MAEFLNTQLDFILFFYGLAFLLLGAVAAAASRATQNAMPWPMLAAFGYIHGVCEWLDLLALILGDSPAFALARTALMTVSFVALMEFGRLDALRHGIRMPGRWIYLAPVALVVLGWHLAGVSGANTFARYVLGFPGATLVCSMLALHARRAERPPERRWLAAAAIVFALYGLAAGIVVPNTPDWHADFLNYPLFIATFGMPVQFVRGVIACFAALCLWAYWGERLIVEAGSLRYAKLQHRQFVWTIAAMGAILVAGWALTQALGEIYKRNIEETSLGDLNLIASRLDSEIAPTGGMVKALAGAASIRLLAAGDAKADRTRVDDVLALQTKASGADIGFILDAEGQAIAATARALASNSDIVRIGQDFSATSFFKSAMTGTTGHQFAMNLASATPNYFVSHPIRSNNGEVTGVAVLKKALDRFEADLQGFNRSFAMIDAYGVVLLSNRPAMRLRTLWPLPQEQHRALTGTYGALNATPALQHEIVGNVWTAFDGERDYVQRRALAHGDWSLVTWRVTRRVTRGIFASRVVGIVITLQMAVLALFYLIGRQRWMHDNVQLEKRFELEELARRLDKRAATDPLTGLFNRRKFDGSLATEITRAERYKTQLSLMLFDVDHFKKINDNFGHQMGDNVLIELSRFVAGHIRNSDVLARWGGEEFVILSPGNSGPMACLLAGNLLAGIGKLQFAEVGSVTCSFGVAHYQPGDTAETLLARADEALYRAKSNGRNRIELAEPPQPGSPPQMVLPLDGTSPPTVPDDDPDRDTAGNLTPIKAP